MALPSTARAADILMEFDDRMDTRHSGFFMNGEKGVFEPNLLGPPGYFLLPCRYE